MFGAIVDVEGEIRAQSQRHFAFIYEKLFLHNIFQCVTYLGLYVVVHYQQQSSNQLI